MTVRHLVTRLLQLLVVVVCVIPAAPASAQIIVTMVPRAEPKPLGEFEWPTGIHVFGGYAGWSYGYTRTEFETDKSRNGYLVAADFGKRVSESITVGGGGWYNDTSEYGIMGWSDLTDPLLRSDIEHRFKRSMYSIYGSVFYKMVGIQAGVIPVHVRQTTIVRATRAAVSDDDGGQVDATVFGVARFGESEEMGRMSVAVGFGMQRFGARDANAGTGIAPPSPSSWGSTAFVTMSLRLVRGLSADLSGWYTYGDEAGGVRNVGNRSQTRASLGVGYQFR